MVVVVVVVRGRETHIPNLGPSNHAAGLVNMRA